MSALASARTRALRALRTLRALTRAYRSLAPRRPSPAILRRALAAALALALTPAPSDALVRHEDGKRSAPSPGPSISLYPADGSTVSSSWLSFSAEACDSTAAVTDIHLYLNGAEAGYGYGGSSGCATASGSGYLSPGWNTVSAQACDSSGSCTRADSYVYFDPPPPTISFSPGDSSIVYGNPQYLNMYACTSWGDIAVAYVYVNGVQIAAGSGSGWGCASLWMWEGVSLDAGWNTVSGYACDPYHCTSSSVALYFVPPAPSIEFSPVSWSTVYDDPAAITGSACSAWGASVIDLYVNGAHVSTGYGSGTDCATTSASAPLSPGWNTLSAHACNAWGSCGSADAYVYYAPPAPTISFSPADSATVYESPSTVSAEACSPWDVSLLYLYVNGSFVASNWGGGWGCASTAGWGYFSPGWNSVSAYACNSHSNCGWSSEWIYFEPPAPSISFWPSDGSTTWSNPSYQYASACTPWGDVSVIDMYVNGAPVSTGYGSGWGCASTTAWVTLQGGWNTVSATACNDYACGSSSISVYFVPPAPEISFSVESWSDVYDNPLDLSASACSQWDASVIELYVNDGYIGTGYGGGWGCATVSAAVPLVAGWNTLSAYGCNEWGRCAWGSTWIYYVPPPPTVSLSIADGTTVYGSPHGVSAEACGSWGVEYVAVYVNGWWAGSNWSDGSSTAGCLSASASAYLDPGWNSVTGYACNSYWNCAESTVYVYYEPPPVEIDFWFADGMTVYTSPYYVGADACADPDVSFIELYVNDTRVETGYGGGWGCATAVAEAALAPGLNTVSAYACNVSGQCATAATSLYYVPPPVTVTLSPSSYSTVHDNPSTISAEACGDGGIAVVYLYVNNRLVTTTTDGGQCVTASASVQLTHGWNSMNAHACNYAGDCVGSSGWVYLAPPPPVFVFSHVDGETVSSANPNAISVEACSPFGGVWAVYLYHNGALVATGYGNSGTEVNDVTSECASASATVNLVEGWNTISAFACNDYECGEPSVYVHYPPPAYTVSVSASGPATTIPGHPGGAASFRVKHTGGRTGAMRIDFSATCSGVAKACDRISPASVDAFPGEEYFVLVSFTVDPSGTSGEVTLTATPVGGSAESATARVEPTPVYNAVIGPAAGEARVDRGSGRQQVVFTVENKSDNAAEPLTFEARVTACDGAVVNCVPTNATIALARNTSGTVTVGFDPTGPGTRGVIELQVLPAGGQLLPAVARYDVEVASVLDVEVRSVNPGTAIDRDECLTISTGDGAAYECGALRLVHALPMTRTVTKARTPTLLYNSHHAEPTVFVAVDVRYAPIPGAAAPTTLEATLDVGGRQVQHQFPWVPACQAQWCRLAMRVSTDLPTGLYPYSVQVRALNAAGSLAASAPAKDTLVVVNRRSSSFGAGWWLAGLEELRFPTPDNSKILWIGGDGSSRLYTRKNETVWEVDPTVDRRDTLSAVAGGGYQRHLRNGVRVVFNGYGQHIRTVNRLGYETAFGYDAVGGQSVLRSIKLPTPASGVERTYTLDYVTTTGGAPALRYVHAPYKGDSVRTTTIGHASTADNLVSSIVDPDGSEVAFGFAAGARVGWRRNRLGDVTSFGYEAGAAFARVELDMRRTNGASAPPIVTTICPAEAQGLATCPSGSSLELVERVRTKLDGPRPVDVGDTTVFYLTRWGAPRRIVNGAGYVTTLERTNRSFPMLVTATVSPTGLRTEAVFNDRALLESTRVVDPLDRGCTGTDRSCDAVTTYAWHDKWDMVTEIVPPEKEIFRFGYDRETGNRTFEQAGDDPKRRTTYDYYPDTKLFRASQLAGAAARDSATYDGQLNLDGTRTPGGSWTRFYNDAVGRTFGVQSQIDDAGTLFLLTTTDYDIQDRPRREDTTAPAMNGAPFQRLLVETFYDAEGQTDSVRRSSELQGINPLVTRWVYDAAGRKVKEIAPDFAVDSMVYDEAGNLREHHTRRYDPTDRGRRLVVRMEYDTLNRLVKRITPDVRYGSRHVGIPKMWSHAEHGGTPDYPRYHNDPENNPGGYTVFADVATFEYDVTGMRRADNADAQVWRSYYRNGLLKLDTLVIRTVAPMADGTTWTRHRYGLEYAYDLNGRLTTIHHPGVVAPSSTQNQTRYTYDRHFGALETVTDPLGHVWRYAFNVRGEVDTLDMPRSFFEHYRYDADGQLTFHYGAASGGEWRKTTIDYDARGKQLSANNEVNVADKLTAAYSGLGHLVSSTTEKKRPIGPYIDHFVTPETFKYDALGNMWFKEPLPRTYRNGRLIRNVTINEHTFSYDSVGRVKGARGSDFSDTTIYNEAGDVELTLREPGGNEGVWEDRVSYYGADGKLRASDYRFYGSALAIDDVPYRSVFEEYRYDALGRRVLVRAQRLCSNVKDPDTGSIFPTGECNQSMVRRTVWDGHRELYEIQRPAQETTSADVVENDDATLQLLRTPEGYDPNPLYGRVAYTYGVGIDQPVSIIRMGLAAHEAGYSYVSFDPFTVAPLWDHRGGADNWFFPAAGGSYCPVTDPQGITRCVFVDFPVSTEAYHPAHRLGYPLTWTGTLVAQKRDFANTLYRRNRQYDPRTGRFTQEDPIGLAGGVNLYGFANGDPVNYSDPFGLCGIIGAVGSVAAGAGLAVVTGGTYTVAAALVDAGSGAVCAGAISKMVKLGQAVRAGRAARATAAGARALANARRRAVSQAWRQEQELVRRTGRGTRDWSAAEKDELLRTGRVKGYEGHHINNVEDHPNLAGDPDNVEFVLGRAEHLERHGGNFRSPSSGPPVNRNPDP